MAPKSRFFKKSFTPALLWSAALAVALLVQVSPVRSETIDLVCTTTGAGPAFSNRFQVDTDRRSVVSTGDRGTNRYAITTVTEQFIKFSDQSSDDNFTEGTIDRIAGTLSLNNTNTQGFLFSSSRWTCIRATKKF